VGVIGSLRRARKWGRRDDYSDLLWFLDFLPQIRSSDSLDVTLNFVSYHLVPFVYFISLFQQ
jgi:hypothetical protein